jgi:CheY-like chemotaxis protein
VRAFQNVLIVDDSATSRMIIQRCVEMSGLRVGTFTFAENGLEAMTRFKSDPGIDLVITDINMPKMDGQTFTRLMKEGAGTKDLPVIVVSSIATETAEAELLALGVMAVIRKPISPAKILVALGGIS